MKDKRRRDLDNMLASVQDVLTEAGIIIDDNIFYISEINASLGGIDNENPRAEVALVAINSHEKIPLEVKI